MKKYRHLEEYSALVISGILELCAIDRVRICEGEAPTEQTPEKAGFQTADKVRNRRNLPRAASILLPALAAPANAKISADKRKSAEIFLAAFASAADISSGLPSPC